MEMVEKKQAKSLFFALLGNNVSIPEHFLLQFAALLCLKGQSGVTIVPHVKKPRKEIKAKKETKAKVN